MTILSQGETMQKVFRYFFFAIVLLTVACGQKGALYLSEEEDTDPKRPAVTIDNPNAKIIPDFVQIEQLTISGKLVELSQNTATGWQALLFREEKDQSIRYVIFEDNLINNSGKSLTMLLGTVQSKVIRNQIRDDVPAGNYLRFRSLEKGVAQIPTVINRAKSYLAANPRLQRGVGNDFLIENNQYIDLYIPVENILE